MSTSDGRSLDPRVFEDWSQPVTRLRAEVYCLCLTIMPRPSKTRTAVTLALVGIWGVMILEIEISHPHVSVGYDAGMTILVGTTALVFSILGRMWGVEVDGIINGLSASDSDTNTDDTENSRR